MIPLIIILFIYFILRLSKYYLNKEIRQRQEELKKKQDAYYKLLDQGGYIPEENK